MKLKKAGLITKLVIVILVVYAAVSLIRVHDQIEAAKSQQEELTQQAQELELENAAMEYALENQDEDSVKAEIARDKLGLVYPDEEIFTGN